MAGIPWEHPGDGLGASPGISGRPDMIYSLTQNYYVNNSLRVIFCNF